MRWRTTTVAGLLLLIAAATGWHIVGGTANPGLDVGPEATDGTSDSSPALIGRPTPDSVRAPGDPPSPPDDDSPSDDDSPVVIRGHVVHADGRKARFPVVYFLRKNVEPHQRSLAENVVRLSADATGEFRGSIARESLGEFRLWGHAGEGEAAQPASLEASELVLEEPIEIVLGAARALRVTVVDESGARAGGAKIRVLPLDPRPPGTLADVGEPALGLVNVQLEPDGRDAELSLPYDGPLSVRAYMRGYALAFEIVDAGVEDVTLRLMHPASRIVVHLANADEWPYAYVDLASDDPRYGERPDTYTSAKFVNGTATFENVVGPGRYQVRVKALDAEPATVSGLVISESQKEVEATLRLEMRAGFGRLLVAWSRESEVNPRVWVRRPGKSWEQWMLNFTQERGLQLRLLPVGNVDVFLVAADCSWGAVVPAARIGDRTESTVAPLLRPMHAFRLPELAVDPRTVVEGWVTLDDGAPIPAVGHRQLGLRLPPDLYGAGDVFYVDMVFQVPSPTAVLHWRTEAGEEQSAALVLVE